MTRRPATITQADIARIIRAAKQAGAAEVVIGQRPQPIELLSRRHVLDRLRMTDEQFDLFLGTLLFPHPDRDGLWSSSSLERAIARLDVRRITYIGYERVYFIAGGRYIKIGYSASVALRLAALQGSTPAKLALLGSIPGGEAIERHLHGIFAAYRHHGEWFHKRRELLAYIDWIGASKTP